MDVAEDALTFTEDTKWVKQKKAHHQLDLYVTLIRTTIDIVLRLPQQERSAKLFSYVILAHPYGNHGK